MRSGLASSGNYGERRRTRPAGQHGVSRVHLRRCLGCAPLRSAGVRPAETSPTTRTSVLVLPHSYARLVVCEMAGSTATACSNPSWESRRLRRTLVCLASLPYVPRCIHMHERRGWGVAIRGLLLHLDYAARVRRHNICHAMVSMILSRRPPPLPYSLAFRCSPGLRDEARLRRRAGSGP